MGRWWRLPLIVLAAALPVGLLWSDPPTGQYAGLGIVLVLAISLAVSIAAAMLASIPKYLGVPPMLLAGLFVATAGGLSSVALWKQYIPADCIGKSIQVRVAGEILDLPPEMEPLLAKETMAKFFGRAEKKADHALFCRMSQNGTRPVDVNVVSITPSSNEEAMTSACATNDAPTWCEMYAVEPYRHISNVLIAPATRYPVPESYWRGGGSLDIVRHGTLEQGWLCLIETNGRKTDCREWRPFGSGSLLTVSTGNSDPILNDMPVEEALEMVRKARNTFLAMVQQ